MKNNTKEKLKRRGQDLFRKYQFNSNNIIELILQQIDNGEPIDETICEVIFDLPPLFDPQRYELISYYPNKLKEIKYINEEIVNNLYTEYGETINIMKENRDSFNVRGKLSKRCLDRSKLYCINCNITSEDIILVRTCPYLGISLEYGNTKSTNNSASLDRINPQLGYVKGNIEVISQLANQMKSSANKEQLITFAKSILKQNNLTC